MAAGLSVDLEGWRREFDELMLRVGGRFARVEPRGRMAAFVRGLLAGLARVNCGSIAEHPGNSAPGMQRPLSAAAWDNAGMRDDLRCLCPGALRRPEVLRLVGLGHSNQEICTTLYISMATTKTHIGRLLAKLDARDRAQLVIAAYQSGLAC